MRDHQVPEAENRVCPFHAQQKSEPKAAQVAVQSDADEAIVTFYQTVPGAPLPRRARAFDLGWAPANAIHYCAPFTTAAEYGWYLFPPVEFSLTWDGRMVYWKPGGEQKWRILKSASLPGYEEHFRQAVPYQDDYLFPLGFLATEGELPGVVQIVTGLYARTRPGWGLLIRPPANRPRHAQFDVLEGVLETDWWFGPILTNIRLCVTNEPIKFSTHTPLFQAQPIPTAAYRDATLDSAVILADGLSHFTPEDWQAYADARHMRHHPKTKPGSYKAEVRRRAKLERAQTKQPKEQ